MLSQVDGVEGSIKGCECMSLIEESEENWKVAITHRESEIENLEKYLSYKNVPDDYDYSDLADRYELLAMLYEQVSQSKEAKSAYLKAKQALAKHERK